MDRFGGIETEDTDQDEFGGVVVAEAEPELSIPSSLISPDGLQMPVLDDSLLPQHDPNYINRFGVPLDPPVPDPTWGTGFSEELKQNAGDEFRGGLGFIPSTLRAIGTIASDPKAALVNLGRNIIAPVSVNVPPSVSQSIPEQQPAYQMGERVDAGLSELFPRREEAGLDTSVREGLGQMASMLATGGAAKAAGLGLRGATTTATTLGGVMEFDDAFKRARQRGDDPDTALSKALSYTTVSSLIENRLGVGRVLRQMFPSAAEAAKKLTALGVSKKILGNFVAGGTEEGSQRFTQNWIVDEKPSMEGVGEEALVGSLVQGTVSLPSAGVGTRGDSPAAAPTTQEETIALPLLEEPTVVGEARGISAAEAEAGINELAPEAAADLDIRSLAEQRPEEPTQPGLTAGEITAVGFFPAVSEAQGLGEQAGPPTVQDVRDKRAQDAREAQAPQPDWRVAVQPSEGEVPGFVQIVDPRGTEQSQSPTVESLRAAGYEVPDFSKLPKGSYTYEEATAKLKEMEAAPKKPKQNQPAKTPIPEAKDVTSASYKLGREIKAEDIPRLEAERAGVQSEYAEAIKTAMQTGNFSVVEEITKRSQFLDEAIKFRRGLDEAAKLGKPTNAQLSEIEQRIGLAANALSRNAEEAPAASTVTPMGPAEFGKLVKANQPIPADRLDAGKGLPPPGWVREGDFYVPGKAEASTSSSGQGNFKTAMDVLEELAKKNSTAIIGGKSIMESDRGVPYVVKMGEFRAALKKEGIDFPQDAIGFGKWAKPIADLVLPKWRKVIKDKNTPAPDQTRRGIGFLPRQLEGQGGIGFSEALAPTVASVQQQRADDARESGTAPGEKTKESQGTWFAGKNPRETARMMQARADEFLKSLTDEQAIQILVNIAGGDRRVPLDNQAYNFVVKDLLVRITKRAQTTKNPVESNEAWKQIDRLAELARRIGAEDARSLVSRNLAFKQIDWLMPVLAWRGIVQEKWKKFLKVPEGKTVDEVVKEAAPTPEEIADAVEEEVERNEAEQSAQSIINKLAESQSDTLKWPKWKVDGVRETVKWYILGDIADGEFQATMESLKVDPNTTRVLLGVANREFIIRDGWRQRKTAEQKARRQNEAEMRQLRARAYIAFKMGTEAERTADSILNEFAKTQSDTPAWTPKVYNQVREVFNGFMRGDITEAEFRASLETVNVGGGKIGALLGVAKRELQTREFYRQAKAAEDLQKLVRDKDKIAALFRKLSLGEGVNWRDMFLDNPRSTQAERRKFLFDKIKSDPKFASLSKEEKAELERSLSEAWERQRMSVFRQEFGKLIKLPRVEVEKTIKELMPELIRQANLGTLDDSAFLNAFAKKLGLPEISSEKANKITELSQKAQKEPQGIRRNKVMEEMIQLLQSGSDISKWDLLRDTWYGSVLMRAGTMLNVLAGSYSTGASFAGLAALDRTLQLKPLQGIKILGQFIGGTIEGTLIADQIARKGAYHLLPDAEQRMINLLSGKSGARFDNLEELLRRGNPLGVLAYTRRFMAALDYIGALGTRDAQVLYGALTHGDQESLDALDKRYDKAENKRAEQQARAEMGPKASRAEVMVRKREILEEGVAELIKENAIQVGRRAAQNAEPRGVPGWIYRLTAKIPFFARATLGLAFMRSAMNMVQNASDYMPGIGAITALRGKIGTLPENHILHKFGMDIPVEERRMMLAAQVSSLGIGLITAAMFLGDDDDKEDGWEISGGWRGLSPKQKSQLMEMGERPNSIRFGKNSPWISFKQMPFAPPLAIVGTMRDEERFHAKDWDGQSTIDKLVPAWLTGWMYMRDISSLSGIAALFDGNSWNTQETPAKLTQKVSKFASQSIGRAGAGYIPSVIREIDELGDSSLYRPSKEEMAGWWIRNIPFARRTVGPGPALNNFGEPIQLTPPPIKSWAGFGKDNDLYNTLGKLASEGVFLPEPGNTAKIVDDDGNYREMTEDEWYQFIKIRGPIFKAGFNEGQLEWLRDADKSQVVDWLKEHNSKANDAARKELFPLTRIKSLRRTPPE